MPDHPPAKVLITGGREVGGLDAFARGLAEGFTKLGIPAEVVPAEKIFRMWRELRDANVLKILSTTAVFAAPMTRRAICVSHGIARADAQGWLKMFGITASYKLANRSSSTRFVAVSNYVAAHLQGLFKVRIDAVIHNPLQSMFFEPYEECDRRYLTFAGRLIPAKNIHRLLPAMCELQKENRSLSVCVIGDGPMRQQLRESFPGVEFTGNLSSLAVRAYLRQTKVFASGTEMEALGIGYLEALSQGCRVAMPACGGGLEIALDQIGKRIHLLPLSWDRAQVISTLRRAWCQGDACAESATAALARYQAKTVAQSYLDIDGTAGGGCA